MQIDPNGQDQLKKLFTEKFKTRTRDEWAEIFDGTDACTTPVLTFTEAEQNPHIVARTGLIELDGVVQHAPAPRFSRTPSSTPPPTVPTPFESVWAD
jgi:alpha-methylacyl-CoA racemase